MEPKLIVVGSPLKGMTFALSNGEVSVGREPANQVCLNDLSVSRRHCVITPEAGKYKLTDLDSFNGTFVNGVPVKEQLLQHGDQITVGDIPLLFLLHEAEANAAGDVQLDEEHMITRSTVRLQREEAFYLHPDRVLGALPPTARVARDLNTLLRISTLINAAQDLEELQRRVLELTLESLPAERAAILLTADGSVEHFSAFGWSRAAGRFQSLRVSRTIVTQVLSENLSVLSNDVLDNKTLSDAESLVAACVRSLLCVPLSAAQQTLGVIYLDTSDPVFNFDDGHLQLMTAIAAIAAVALEKAQNVEALEGENRWLREELKSEYKIIGEGPAMRELYRFITKAAPSDATVLICGESGTGKEVVARALHAKSLRAQKPLVAINCATLNDALLESELFGHEKGAFTGAAARKLGKLEIADAGTVFLDEVGELPLTTQAKLLRVLQEFEFERVGGTRSIKVNIRIIAATNRDLEEAIRQGTFRQDLYFRLNVISFTLPPLRDRREDIMPLADYFAAESSRRAKRKPVRISVEARSCLLSYGWPGNVRELANVIERAIVLGSTDTILPEDLPEALLETAASAGAPFTKFYEALREVKKRMLLDAVQQAGGNYAEAAKLIGIHPNNLHRLLRNLNLKPELGK